MRNKFSKLTCSSGETKALGLELAEKISKQIPKIGARAVILKGDLGTGKTTFVLGFLKYFGISPHAASPTFVIMKKYEPKTKKPTVKNIYHLDAYRLRSKEDLNALGFDEILKDPRNIILIEWPERIKGARFKNKITISFSYAKKENERMMRLK
jgi:tRNA threonylcarbamoyladenosine biosynthesis protein TsaE